MGYESSTLTGHLISMGNGSSRDHRSSVLCGLDQPDDIISKPKSIKKQNQTTKQNQQLTYVEYFARYPHIG